jgi:pSer/pThr/pTyr-binding forkhead associated (FHA) protein
MFKLVIQDDEGKTTVVPLIRDEITIGRKEGNTIRLTERNVSRRHARILRNNGEVHIEDLGSYNGIRVNNARIAERVSLRVSDQVQIGDYKLYLKAEGLEQADESRTVPLERLDSQIPTEAMAAVVPAVTAPQPVQPAPQAATTNRSLVAIGDTDPAGRAVGPATAAAVAALTAPGGYGKLVVVSSNFAGKEFELTRPQMIIGRTDENDIVVNHRSISRNHAKLVREPETSRYTISDLQSSNGVRVNGQDYGKVELRRGDVVDLGHVRLRFVEAGEDFVFDRDAVITDVPESGGKRGAMFVVLAAIVLLGAGVAIYTTMMHGGGDKPKDSDVVAPGPGTNSALMIDAGDTAVAVDEHPDHPGTEPAVAAVPVVVDAAVAAAVVPRTDDEKGQKVSKCVELQARQDWQALNDCARALDKLGVKDKAKEYTEISMREQKNELTSKDVRQLLRDRNLREAQAALGKISNESVYYVSLREAVAKAESSAIDAATRKGQAFANARDCASLRTLYKQLGASSTPRVAAAVAGIKCTDKVAAAEPAVVKSPPPPVGAGSGQAVVTAPPPKSGCDAINVDDSMAQASNQFSNGYAGAALALVLKALPCKSDIRMYRIAAMYACAARDLANAKLYFKKVVDPSLQGPIEQKCQQNGLDVRAP